LKSGELLASLSISIELSFCVIFNTRKDMTGEIQPTILRPSKVKLVLLLLACLVFVVIGIFMGRSGHWLNYFGAAFFALGIPVAVIQMLPNASYLEIASEGFTVSSLFRKHFVPWLTVDKFRIIDASPLPWSKTEMVGYDLLHPNGQASRGQKFSKFVGGAEGALPDTYGKKAEDLLEIMNTCLAKAREQSGERKQENPS
jgi:hypothetical protein